MLILNQKEADASIESEEADADSYWKMKLFRLRMITETQIEDKF